MTDSIRTLTGKEETVHFSPDEKFTGVTLEWLAPRLRLASSASPVDLLEGRMLIYLDHEVLDVPDGDLIQDIAGVLGTGPHDGELVSYGDGGIIGGRFDVIGEWVEDWAAEIRHELTHIGRNPDLKALAKSYLIEGTYYWEPHEDQLFEVDSPYLSVDDAEDVHFVLEAAEEAGMVTLNGTTLFPPG